MLLTVSEVAKQLKVNQNYVYKLLNAGILPYLVIGSKKVRQETLDSFLETYEGKDVDNILEGELKNE